MAIWNFKKRKRLILAKNSSIWKAIVLNAPAMEAEHRKSRYGWNGETSALTPTATTFPFSFPKSCLKSWSKTYGSYSLFTGFYSLLRKKPSVWKRNGNWLNGNPDLPKRAKKAVRNSRPFLFTPQRSAVFKLCQLDDFSPVEPRFLRCQSDKMAFHGML